MNKKVYADYHGPRCTRENDGEVAQWKYYGKARKSKAEETEANYNPDCIRPNGLNDIATLSYPLIGMQSQHDRDYIEYQILLAKIAHIDGFFVEWGFKEHKSNEELLTMLALAEQYDFEIGINWCDAWHFYDWIEEFHEDATTRERKVELFKENVQYLLDTLFTKKTGAKFNGHPIILLFGGGPTLEEFEDILKHQYHLSAEAQMPYFFTRAAINGTENAMGKVDYFLEENGWIDKTAGVFGWIPTRVRNGLVTETYNKWDRYATEEDVLAYMQTLYKTFLDKKCKVKISCVNPEMDNRACASWNKHDLSYIPRKNGKIYEEMWKFNVQNKKDIDIVYIVSWNDYTERHQIEPTLCEGYREIMTTQKYAAQYKDIAETSDALDLPMKLFSARKRVAFFNKVGLETSSYEEALDTIALKISQGEYQEARLFLEGLGHLLESLKELVSTREKELTLANEGLKLEENKLIIQDREMLEDLKKGYFKAWMIFEYLDDEIDDFQIIHEKQIVCDIRTDGTGGYKKVKIALFKENLEQLHKHNTLIFPSDKKIRNVKLYLKRYKLID